METAWIMAPSPDAAVTRRLADAAGIPAVFARVLARRGLREPDTARAFLEPDLPQLGDPSGLAGAEDAIRRLQAALERGERILIHGDYDVDGTTATALLVTVLRSLGGEVSYFIPHRLRDGYGFSERAVDHAAAIGASLIVTADCGIGAVQPVAHARKLGIDSIVTDHHEIGRALPEAIAVVNPKRCDCPYPFKEFSGVGVAFKVLQGLIRSRGRGEERILEDNLDLVALGTIADVVPLRGENRVLAHTGLARLTEAKKLGIRSLVRAVGLEGRRIESSHVAFLLAPRINAAGRLGDSETGIRLLLSEDAAEADELAARLERNNESRRKLDETMLDQAVEQLAAQATLDAARPIVLWSEEWHSGVLGIVASRLVERYRVPAILIAVDGGQGRGSGRSVGGFDLVNALSGCADLLGEWGGHKFAVGLNIRRERLEEFRERFAGASMEALAGMDRRPVLEIEDEIRMVESDRQLALLCEKLAPFGYENSEPLFVTHGVQLLEPPQRTGEQGQHLRLTAYQEGHTRACIGFGLGEMADAINRPNLRFSLAYVPTINRWRGRETVQLRVKDLKVE